MSEVYRGRRIPRGLPPELRRLIREHDRALARSTALLEQVQRRIDSTFDEAQDPPTSKGAVTVFYPKSSLPIELPPSYTVGEAVPGSKQTPVVAVSDGRWMHPLAKAPHGPVLDVKDFGAVGDGYTDDTGAFFAAVEALPSEGGTIRVPRSLGSYVLTDSITIRKSDVCVLLEPGVTIEKDSSVNSNEPFVFLGTGPTSYDDLTADPSAGAVSITVTTPGDFEAGDWIIIKDDQSSSYSSSWVHKEINRVRSKAGGTLTLEYPLIDSYVTGGVAPSVGVFTPVINSGLRGRGRIRNGTSASVGNAGVRHSYCVGGYVQDVEFEKCRSDSVRYNDSTGGVITGCYMHDVTDFDGDGRGVVARGSTHVLIANNVVVRVRHGFDISYFSRNVVVANNVLRGFAESALKCHPHVSYCWMYNNTLDGGYGFAAGTNDWGSTYAPGIGIDQHNTYIYFEGNRVQNIQSNGFKLSCINTNHIYVRGNWFKRTNLAGNQTDVSAIRMAKQNATNESNANLDCVIEDNIIEEPVGRGIFCSLNGTIIRNNVIRDVSSDGSSPSKICGIWVSDPGLPGTEDVTDVVVEGNFVDTVANGYGIQLAYANGAVRRCTVRGNHVKNCVGSGIKVNAALAYDIYITENFVKDCNTSGAGSTSDGLISAFTTSSTASANTRGVYVIARNTLIGIGRYGIICNITASIIDSNVINGITSTTSGIGFGLYVPSPGGTNSCTIMAITNNVITTPSTDCMLIGGSAGVSVSSHRIGGNHLYGAGRYNLYLNSDASSNDVFSNYVYGAGTANVLDSGTGNVFLNHIDGTNNRVGFNTSAPARTGEFRDASNPALRVSATGTYYTDFHSVNVGGAFDGLAVLPAANSSGYYSTVFFGTNEGNGFAIFDDGSDVWLRTTQSTKDLELNIANNRRYNFNINFAAILTVQQSGIDLLVPGSYRIADSATSTPTTVISLYHQTDGTVAAGFGTAFDIQLENAAGTFPVKAGTWLQEWSDPTAGSEDAQYRWLLRLAGTETELMRLDAGVPGLRLENGMTAAPRELLDVVGDARVRSLRVDGDTGAGVASTVTHTNLVTAIAGGGGPATLGNIGGTNEPTGAAQTHWLKFYDGTTVRYLPVWT